MTSLTQRSRDPPHSRGECLGRCLCFVTRASHLLRHTVSRALSPHRPGLAFIALGAFAAPNGQAASQILGLVASNGLPTPLQCQDGSCSGHFSSFCLQEARPAPSADSEYALAPGGSLTLIATMADGSQARLPGNGLLSLRTMIGFTSIRISLPEAKLKALGAVSVAVEVAPMTSAMPVPVANDVNPQTREEIAFATGAMRHLAQAAFEDRNGTADAARLSSLVINALPPMSRRRRRAARRSGPACSPDRARNPSAPRASPRPAACTAPARSPSPRNRATA